MSVKIENLSVKINPDLYSGYTVYDDGNLTSKVALNTLKTLITAEIDNPTFTGDVVVENTIRSLNGDLNINSNTPTDPNIGDIVLTAGNSNVIYANVVGDFHDGSLNNTLEIGTRGHGYHTELKGDLVMLRTNSVTGDTEYDVTLDQSGVFSMTGLTNVSLPTGTTMNGHNIRPYKVYAGLFNQTGTTAPTVSVLENTLNTITWSYDSVGRYIGTLSIGSVFTSNKTLSPQDGSFITVTSTNLSIYRESNTQIIVEVLDSATGDSADNRLVGKFIEIRVYN